MTVTTTTNTVVYRGNGSATEFAVPFTVLDEDHLVVQRRVYATGEVEETYVGTDYTYSGIGDPSGTLTLDETALSSDYELVIERSVPYRQELDIVNSGGFYPDTVERQLDLMTMGLQQLEERTGRSLQVPIGENPLILPSAAARGGHLLGFEVGTGEISLEDANGGVTNSELMTFDPPGVGSESRSVSNKLSEWISITDFGADPTGTLDSTAAVQRAMRYHMDRFDGEANFYTGGFPEPAEGGAQDFNARDRRTGLIYIPAGVYKVQSEVFSSLEHDRSPYVGFLFYGEHRYSSVFLLETGDEESWFFKTSEGNERYQAMGFANLTFRGDNYEFVNFAKVYSSGGPKQFTIRECDFYVQQYMQTEGVGNADLMQTIDSYVVCYGIMLTLNNDQSVQHNFTNTDFRCWSHLLDVLQHGGGNVIIQGASIDFVYQEGISPDDGNFIFTHAANASIGSGNCTYTIRDSRVEIEAYMLRPSIRAATNAAGYAVGVGTVTLAASGTGAISVGDRIIFGTGDRTRYTVTSGDVDISNGGAISFTPNLVQAIPAATTSVHTNEPPFGVVKMVENGLAFPRVTLDNVNFVNGRTYLIDEDGTILTETVDDVEVAITDYRRIPAFQMWPGKYVEIRGGVMLKCFEYWFDGSRDTQAVPEPFEPSAPPYGGIVYMTGVLDGTNDELPEGDENLVSAHSRSSYGGSAGRLITEGMEEHTGGSSFERFILDADPRWQSSFAHEPASREKIVHFKQVDNGAPNGTDDDNDHYIVLPYGIDRGIVAIEIVVIKPAGGQAGRTYQLHLKEDDRSGALIAESVSGDFDDEHTITVSHEALTGVSRICLCASGTFGSDPEDFYSDPFIAYMRYI